MHGNNRTDKMDKVKTAKTHKKKEKFNDTQKLESKICKHWQIQGEGG